MIWGLGHHVFFDTILFGKIPGCNYEKKFSLHCELRKAFISLIYRIFKIEMPRLGNIHFFVKIEELMTFKFLLSTFINI